MLLLFRRRKAGSVQEVDPLFACKDTERLALFFGLGNERAYGVGLPGTVRLGNLLRLKIAPQIVGDVTDRKDNPNGYDGFANQLGVDREKRKFTHVRYFSVKRRIKAS